MKPKLIVETKLLHSASGLHGTVYETSIKTDRGEEIGRLRTAISDSEFKYSPPPSYVIQRAVREEVQRMLEFR